MQALKQLVVHLLRDTANKIDAGTCELNATEATELIEDCLESATDEAEYRKRFDDDDDMRYRSRYGYGRRY